MNLLYVNTGSSHRGCTSQVYYVYTLLRMRKRRMCYVCHEYILECTTLLHYEERQVIQEPFLHNITSVHRNKIKLYRLCAHTRSHVYVYIYVLNTWHMVAVYRSICIHMICTGKQYCMLLCKTYTSIQYVHCKFCKYLSELLHTVMYYLQITLLMGDNAFILER